MGTQLKENITSSRKVLCIKVFYFNTGKDLIIVWGPRPYKGLKMGLPCLVRYTIVIVIVIKVFSAS